jgi:hypothetical protein
MINYFNSKSFVVILFQITIAAVCQAQIDWKIDGNTVNGDAKIGTNNSYDIIFETSNLERMRLLSNGNLGLGTLNPQARLHVNGNILLTGSLLLQGFEDSNSNENRYLLTDETGAISYLSRTGFLSDVYKYDCNVGGLGSNVISPTWASMANQSYGIIYTGFTCPAKVGIGTDNPLSALDLRGDLTIKSNSNPEVPILDIQNNLTNTGLFKLLNSGKIHINTTSTGGNAFFNLGRFENNFSELNNIFSITDEGNISSRYFGSWQDPFSIKIGNTNELLFRIMHNGSLNLNYQNSSNSDLVVNIRDSQDQELFALVSDGVVWCRGIKIKNPPFWGDFVFNENYDLMSLNDLSIYVSENSKLPNFPSENEVLECGLDLETIVALQTVKIEELTRYILMLNEKINKIEEKSND